MTNINNNYVGKRKCPICIPSHRAIYSSRFVDRLALRYDILQYDEAIVEMHIY